MRLKLDGSISDGGGSGRSSSSGSSSDGKGRAGVSSPCGALQMSTESKHCAGASSSPVAAPVGCCSNHSHCSPLADPVVRCTFCLLVIVQAVFGWGAVVWTNAFPILWGWHTIFLVNSASHLWGRQPYDAGGWPLHQSAASAVCRGESIVHMPSTVRLMMCLQLVQTQQLSGTG